MTSGPGGVSGTGSLPQWRSPGTPIMVSVWRAKNRNFNGGIDDLKPNQIISWGQLSKKALQLSSISLTKLNINQLVSFWAFATAS
jgi:hypothetical protein